VRRQRRLVVWALGLGALSWVLAFASGTAWMHLYLALPGIGWFRQPHRLLLLAHFSAALLAGVTLDALRRGAAREERGARTAALGVVPVACALALVASAALAGQQRAVWLAAGAGTAAALWRWMSTRRLAGLATGAIFAVAAGDLLLASSLREPLPYTAATSTAYRSGRGGDLQRYLGRLSGESRTAWMLFGVDVDTKRAAAYAFRRLEDFEPLSLRRQSEYFGYLRRQLPRDRLVDWYAEMGARSRLLDLAAVRYFAVTLDPRPAYREAARAFVEGAGLERRGLAAADVALFENPRSLPRAYVTYRTAPAPPRAELLAQLSRKAFDPLVESFVEGDPGFTPALDAPARGRAARLTRDEETLVEVEADLSAPGLLVLADSYYRGWRARVDGEPAPILPTNHLFRGVPVPAGRHRVRFEYRPWSLRIGAAMTCIGVGVLITLTLRARRAARGIAA
jgi:hypothetical protein